MIKRAVGISGYDYSESESTEFEGKIQKVFDTMSFYTKFRILVEMIMFEYLSHIFIFRWIFNIFRLLIALLDLYPILAIISFGKKYAFVEIMKAKKVYKKI